MTGKKKEGEKVATGYPAGGEKPAFKEIYQGIEKIFERAEYERHEEHAEELLARLIDKKLLPLESGTWFKYDEAYGDLELFVPWWDYDEGAPREVGTLSAVVRFVSHGKFLSDEEIERQVDEIRKDLQQKVREREERGKEIEESEVEENE
jgi:hypothetical protein